MYEDIEIRRKKLDAFRPFSRDILRRLDAVFEPCFIHASNAIEGNTLTLGETRSARLLANLSLMRDGHCMLIFRASERREVYLNALRLVDGSVARADLHPSNLSLGIFPFVTHMEQELLASYDLALDVVEGRMLTEPDDLARSFSAMEGKALARLGIAPDEQSRLVALAENVHGGTDKITDELQSVIDPINEKLLELRLLKSSAVGIATSAMPSEQGVASEAWFFRTALGIGTSPARGPLGQITVRFARAPNHQTDLSLPHGLCIFLVYAEAHALVLASVMMGIDDHLHERHESEWCARVRLPLDPNMWRLAEIRQFLMSEVNRFGKLSIG